MSSSLLTIKSDFHRIFLYSYKPSSETNFTDKIKITKRMKVVKKYIANYNNKNNEAALREECN